ncbi:MAG: dockerin type I domain-containing protein [Candidatus Saccharimonadia bacterium]
MLRRSLAASNRFQFASVVGVIGLLIVVGAIILFRAHASSCSLPGDANCDGIVNILDLSIVANNYGKTGTTWAQGDFNADGSTNILDLSILAANWNSGSSGGTSPVVGVNYAGAVSTYLPSFQSVGVTSIRIFALYQPNLEPLLATLAAQHIQPLLILDEATPVNGTLQYCHQSKSQTSNTDQQVVQAFLQAYGSNYQGWFEFGNEPNTSPGNCGYSVAQYSAGWNAVIPQLKAMAPNAWFGGPVLPNTDTAYISSFLQQANPKPDFVSWHLYSGSYTWSTSQLQSGWQGWGGQIGSVNTAVTTTLGHTLPLMVTEWNYAWDGGVGTDPRVTPLSTSVFAQTFAQQVLAEFNSAGIKASYLFDDPGFPSPVGTTSTDPSYGKVTLMGSAF